MGKGRKARDTELSFVSPPLRVMEESPKTVVHPTKFFGEPGKALKNGSKVLIGFQKQMDGPNVVKLRFCQLSFVTERPNSTTSCLTANSQIGKS